jgi:hypothetical protein
LKEGDLRGEKMAAMISYLCERQNKKLKSFPSKIADQMFNKPRKSFIITGNGSYFDEEPGTCWWFMSNVPTGEKQLFLKEAGKFVLGWVGGLSSPFLGLELPATAKDAAEAVTPSGGLLKETVDATVWQLVKKTDNAWVIAIKDCFLGGCAAFVPDGENYNIWLRSYPAAGLQSVEGRIISQMAALERIHGSDHSGGVRETREFAMRGHGFWLSAQGEIREII